MSVSTLAVPRKSLVAEPLDDDRMVKNDTVSRAITKGILDGDLLARFEYLAVDVQTELALNCGTDVDTVLANLRNLRVYE